ncbi:MAG: peptide ABC transporter substrate-binding protein [Spirochaetaceae bacterium]|jgi:peptide/nickel transport system substrate-binding protein/oligopeptide transport system substrate-binding protein|nr:peptide ABC transporter substrate-binding protein [Spirochaetaceae bacterium]
MKNTVRGIIFCLGLLFLLGSCKTAPNVPAEITGGPDEAWNAGDEKKPDGGRTIFSLPENYAESRPASIDRTELTAVFSGEEAELDFRKSYLASDAQIFTALYEGLFSYNPFTLEPVPAAVSSWQLSADKKIWTFTIRQNARFWNGDPLRAQDFRAAWLSMLDPVNEAPYSSLFDIIEGARDYRLGKTADPSTVGITVTGEKILEVRLNAPASFFPSMLCHHSFYPIHPSMLGARADWSAPVSNGPFHVTGRDRGSLTLSKNELYWDTDRVSLDRILLRFTDDTEESAAMWNSGEAHWIAGSVNYDALTDNSGIMVNPMFATYYFFVRSIGPWKDHRLRRALTLALPWENIREGMYLPAKTLIYPISGYPEIEGIAEEDAEEAQRLLEEAGHPKGVGLPELVIRITPSEEHDRIVKLMAAAWMNLGIPVKLEVVPYNRYFQSLKEDNYNIGSTTWIGDFADPYTFLQMWRRDSNLNDALNDDQDYENLMERSMTEEGETRFATLSEAEQLLLDRGTVLPVAYTPAVNVVDTDEIEGWFPNALDIHPFKYFRFKAIKPLPGVARTEAPPGRSGQN